MFINKKVIAGERKIPTLSECSGKIYTLRLAQQRLIAQENVPSEMAGLNDWFTRYEHPVVTAAHIPVEWTHLLDPRRNPFGDPTLGVNGVFNVGAVEESGKIYLICRVEGYDRKSFFAVAESRTGIDGFHFIGGPLVIPVLNNKETNHYDMRITKHEDGLYYGVFCVESKDEKDPDLSAAEAQAGIIRFKSIRGLLEGEIERLPNLKTPSPQQRNVVLHPEFVNDGWAFYTRPQDGFISTGSGGGIGFGVVEATHDPTIDNETVINTRQYHTITEAKNGEGPAPLRTPEGWLHLAHGVRNCAAGLRYVLYVYMTDLADLTKVTYAPGGYFMAPQGEERVGDVSNVVFSNGWVRKPDGTIYIYYGSSDTRTHVAVTTEERLLAYVKNTPPDAGTTQGSVAQRRALIEENSEKPGQLNRQDWLEQLRDQIQRR